LLFPYRVLDQAAVEKIEADPKVAMSTYLQQKLPSAEEWSALKDVVTYASLEQFIAQFPAAKISEMAVKTEAAAGGKISTQRANYFWRDFKTLFRRDYTYNHAQMGRSPKPLIVARATDGMFIQEFMALLRSYGVPPMDRADIATAVPIQNILNLWANFSVNYAPDLFLENWEGRDVILHPSMNTGTPGVVPRNISHFVTNLDPHMVKKFPRVYLASVILGLRDSVDFEITQLSPARFSDLRDKVNEDRGQQRLRPVSTVDADVFFETYGMGFGDTNPLVMEELALLGGTKFKGAIMRISGNMAQSGPSNPQSINFGLEQKIGDLFEFKTAQLKKLAADFPYLNNNGRSALTTGYLKYRLKMMFAPTF